jgi:Protein of unknown function (DUF4197)
MMTMIGKLATALMIYGCVFAGTAHAQSLKDLMSGKGTKDSTGKTDPAAILNKVSKKLGGSTTLSTNEVAEGLKAALNQGVTKGTGLLSATDVFLGNAAVKILMPPEAKKVEETLRKFGMGKQVDQAITSMNRAAEDAAKSAAPIFLQAIKGMSIQDAMGILGGKEDAATQYLKQQTTGPLTEAFRPVIDSSVNKVGATKYWNTIFTNYNKFSNEKINPDLTAYVTEQALKGIFYQVAQEEKNIRENPAARGTELLQKVFGKK